jgi:hypothetical protein
MLRASFVAAKFGVSLNLGRCKHLNSEQVILEMRLPQRGMRGADRFRRGRQRCRGDREGRYSRGLNTSLFSSVPADNAAGPTSQGRPSSLPR